MKHEVQKAVCKAHGMQLEDNDDVWCNGGRHSTLWQRAPKTFKLKHASGVKYKFWKCIIGLFIHLSRILINTVNLKKKKTPHQKNPKTTLQVVPGTTTPSFPLVEHHQEEDFSDGKAGSGQWVRGDCPQSLSHGSTVLNSCLLSWNRDVNLVEWQFQY